MRTKRISNVALAKTLGKSEGAIRRLTDGSSSVKIDTVLQAMNAVGAHAVLAVVTT
jgi:plasmid maintenance system antidote protein VapI